MQPITGDPPSEMELLKEMQDGDFSPEDVEPRAIPSSWTKSAKMLGLASVVLACAAVMHFSSDPQRHLRSRVADGDELEEFKHPMSFWMKSFMKFSESVCRSNSTDQTTMPERGFVKRLSEPHCFWHCKHDVNCTGFEFTPPNHCELWFEPIGYHLPVKGASVCILKNPSCEELKAHKAVFLKSLAELNEFHSAHCLKPILGTYHPADKCSMAYSRRWRQSAEKLCTLTKAACGTDVC
eukprot:TRINITY_DN22776_c0_g1_i1.p1 TRINITY_DN22776_c0_g1~~TRINITY_DN22776_c0_g1_i1.p1  ORF type:complete len:238 (-),score=41.32 TRINITY_DN22776_c0_g1_i1:52-765(-)